MHRAVVVRYEVRADAADENQQLVEKVFAQLAADDPGGVRYATFRLAEGPDTVTFVHIALFDGEANPLADSSAFTEFQRELGNRVVAPPVVADATVIGSYRLAAF